MDKLGYIVENEGINYYYPKPVSFQTWSEEYCLAMQCFKRGSVIILGPSQGTIIGNYGQPDDFSKGAVLYFSGITEEKESIIELLEDNNALTLITEKPEILINNALPLKNKVSEKVSRWFY